MWMSGLSKKRLDRIVVTFRGNGCEDETVICFILAGKRTK